MEFDCIKKAFRNKKILIAVSFAFVISLISVMYYFDNFPWKDILTGNILAIGSVDYALLGKIFLVLFGQTGVLSGVFYVVLNKFYKEKNV